MRTSLKNLQTLTYACTSPQDLHDLTTTVERLRDRLRLRESEQMCSMPVPLWTKKRD